MNGDKPDGFMMIGLHKLAAQNGDGLIPELYALLTREARMQAESPNLTVFPVWEARSPAREVPFVGEDTAPAEVPDNLIAFPAQVASSGRRSGTA